MTFSNKKSHILATVSLIALTSVFADFDNAAFAQDTGIYAHETADAPHFSWGFDSNEVLTDRGLAEANIQLKHEGVDVQPQLNVSANNGEVAIRNGEAVTFQTYWNYGAFIDRSEIRIFESGASVQSTPLMTLPVDAAQTAALPANADLPRNVIYIVRAYDAQGNFDETSPKPLSFFKDANISRVPSLRGTSAAAYGVGYGIDRTAIRNIEVKGGGVTVYGTQLSESARVNVHGQNVLIDADGQFAVQTILPYGEHRVKVDVDDKGQRAVFERDARINETEFFYVGIGDATIGTSSAVGPANFFAEDDRDFDDINGIGRGAFYVKGRVKGDYKVTASLDTGEERLGDIISNLDQKDPRQLLRRLDADRFYPVYGDDSTVVEDAPTQGRFYAKIEKDDSHILWGNFATQIDETEFAHLDRGLYGGIIDHNSKESTNYGERRTQVTAFAADPGTVPAREEFRGTGGSVYFLERQDVSIGSERVRVEIRDKVTGLVIETRDLRPQEDYDVDYIQGRILLSDPLQSTVRDRQIVRDGALSGDDAFLVVRYEFTPSLADVDGFTVGGRGTHWFGDNLRVGVTGQTENTDTADQTLLGADVLLRRSAGTYIKGEFAQTDGPGFDQSESADGGFSFGNVSGAGAAGNSNAYRVEGAIDFSEVSDANGKASAYYDFQEDGFTGTNRLVVGEVERFGAAVSTQLTENTEASVKYDELNSSARGGTRAVYGDISHNFTPDLGASVGVRYDEVETVATNFAPIIDGSRTDISAQVNYKVNDRASVYGFGQVTVDRDDTRAGNDRVGVGGDFKINDRLSLQGEVTGGDGGVGANAQATFTRSDNTQFYLGYGLSADRTDTGFAAANQNLANSGTLTLGARTRYNDSLSVYGEERFGLGSSDNTINHVFGLTFDPSEVWSFGASVENGRIEDDVNGAFDRTAFSVSAARADDNVRLASNLEGRFENRELNGIDSSRRTWLMRNTLSIKANPNWTALGRFNFAISESDESDFLDSDFIEGVVGAAYRPVDNDRFNALASFTFFEDLAPSEQISAGGATALPAQRSQIFNIDGTYDLTKRLSIGAKYGYRRGEVALDRNTDNFIESDAQLGIVRLDYHVIKKWDLLAEGRILSSDLAEDERLGALVGVYRHVGEHAKIGAGYNFASFSDDLRNFEEDNDGFFINVLGKF